MKHAPLGPTMAVADARPDGTVHIHTHNQNPQALRGEIAHDARHYPDHVVVHAYAGPGHYGRSNGGNAGAEDEAVILSKAVGKPVRVQWMRADDFQWSTQSPAAFSDVQIGLDANGKIAAYQIDHYMPAMQDDGPVGAVIAGLPTMAAPATELLGFCRLDAQPIFRSLGLTTASPISSNAATAPSRSARKLRRSPSVCAITACARRAIPAEFPARAGHQRGGGAGRRRRHPVPHRPRQGRARDRRAQSGPRRVGMGDASVARPGQAVSTGAAAVRGRGVSVMFRSGTYWACVCEIAVTPSTGAIEVEKYTIAVDPGIVVNPMQLKRQVEGGAMMGISDALLEEATFDESGITNRDWRTYPILKMADIPEIKVVLLNRPEVGNYGGGSEAANALAAPAIAAALLDATGKIVRRLPLKPAYVQAVLKA